MASLTPGPGPRLALPRWAWITLGVLTAFILLPLYLRWFVFASGGCPPMALIDFVFPRVLAGGG